MENLTVLSLSKGQNRKFLFKCSRWSNWLDSEDGERLDQVLDGILIRDARFCPVLLTLVNESREEIEAAGVMTDLLNRSAAGLTAACYGMS